MWEWNTTHLLLSSPFLSCPSSPLLPPSLTLKGKTQIENVLELSRLERNPRRAIFLLGMNCEVLEYTL
jgi:hypothetical protein